MLYLECQSIFKGKKPEKDEFFPHHITISDLFHAVENKCPLCTLIWEELLLVNTDWALLHDDLTIEQNALLQKLDAADIPL
jgi:hypothetical protein